MRATAQRQEWLRLLQKFPLSKEVHQELSTQVRSGLCTALKIVKEGLDLSKFNSLSFFYCSVGNGLNGLPKELVHFPDGAGIYTGSSGLPIHTRLGPMRGRVCAENQVAGALMNLEISWLHCIKAWTVARERDPSFYFYLNMSPSSYHIIPSLFPHTI